jgi:hypothetical protein
MRVSPQRNAHQVTEKRNAAHHQADSSWRTLHCCRIGPKPYTTVLSKSVGRAFALS